MNPNDQLATRRVVLAGMKLMYDVKTFPTFKQGMMKKMPMPDKLATEAAGLVKMLQDKANGSIPRQVLIPAASMLMLEIAKFMEDVGLAKPTPEEIKQAYAKLVPLMAKAFPNVPPRSAPATPASAPPAAPPMQSKGIINQAQGGV